MIEPEEIEKRHHFAEGDIFLDGVSHGATDLADIEMCKKIAAVLCDHYPGHPWNVAVDSSPTVGMVDIKCLYPDKLGILPRYGYKLRLSSLSEANIVRAGGEILERYKLARSRATPYAALDALHNGLDRAGEIR